MRRPRKTTRIKSTPDLHEAAIHALVDALGYPDAVRFITSLRSERGDYTRDRASMLAGLTLDDILAQSRRIVAEQKKNVRRKSA